MKIRKIALFTIYLLSLVLVLTSCFNVERQTYDVVFDSNGGSSVETQNVEHDKTATRPKNPTKEGHTFINWFEDEAMTSVYDFNKKVRKSFTLYANWNVNKYNISYITNVVGYEIESITVSYGTIINAPEVEDEKFKVEGSHFVGWYLDEDYTMALESQKMPANDLTLYAKWDKNDHKITFVSDDLTHKIVDVKYGDAIPTIELPTKIGHIFEGWVLSKNSNEIVGNNYKITKDITLYAKWAKNKYVITYDSNGGTAVQSAEYNYFDALVAPTAPTKEGHTFAGWYLDDNYFGFNDSKMPANDLKLVAKWNINNYIVKFDTNGGSEIADLKVTFGTNVTEPIAPTRTGYTFAGWYLGEEQYDFNTLMPANNITLVAKWTVNEYTITFDSNEGSQVELQTYSYNSPLTVPTAPTRTGYTFAGWYLGETYFSFSEKTMPAENITLVAKWTVNSYTVKFNSNGGSEITDLKVTYGTKVDEPTAPTKTGYTFAGWYLGEEEYDFNTIMPANDVTLVAKWTVNEYVINFDLNGAEGKVDSINTKYNEEVKAPECNIERLGYTFIKWNTKADGTGTNYFELADLTNISTGDDVTLYAIWTHNEYTLTITLSQTEVYTYTFHYGDSIEAVISAIDTEKEEAEFDGWYVFVNNTLEAFNYVGATMPNGNLAINARYLGQVTITFVSNGEQFTAFVGYESEEITDIISIPTREGYTFGGWYLDEAYENEYNLTVYPTQDINVYAKWTVNTITVKFDGNGSTSGEMEDQSIVYNSNNSLTLNVFQKTGHKFLGWSTEKDATDIKFVDGYNKNVASEGEITLYAVWEGLLYSITFDSNGGTPVSKIEQAYGTSVTAPTAPTKEGHTFKGWLLNNEKYSFSTISAENITLVAEWTVNEYIITFDSNGGTEVTAQIYKYAASLEAPIAPTKEGHTFAGWYLEDAQFTFDGKIMSAEDITLVAKWNINKYTITFNVDGGTPVSKIEQDYGTAVIAPIAPTKEGHTFAGWFLNDVEYTFSTIAAEDITLVAKWTVNEYTITFDSNNGSEEITETYSYGFTLTAPVAPTKEGHTFAGWYLEETQFTFDGKTMPAEDITLVAKWTVNKYSITFDTDGGTLVTKIEQDYGTVVIAPVAPTKEGYTFAGWFLNDVEYTFSTISAENITLVAKWNANKHTLTINTTIDGEIQEAQIYDIYYDQYVLSYNAIIKYAKEGFNFSGWYYDEALTEKATFDEALKVEGDIVLYASYEIMTYTVNFISNGEVIYSTTKKYLQEVSFNEYIEQTKLYAVAYGQLANAIAATIASSSNFPMLQQCLETNMSYYLNVSLMNYISIFPNLTDTQWQEFYGVAKGLYDGAQSLVNIYEDNKVGDNYVPNHSGHFFAGWYLGANTILDNKTDCLFTNITPASTMGYDYVNIVAKWEKLNSVEDLTENEDGINTIVWSQIDTYQLKPETGEILVIKYLIYAVNVDNTLTLLDTVAHDSTKETLEYTFMTADTFSAPGHYNLVVIAVAQILNSNNEVIRIYESDIKESTILEDFNVVVDPENVDISMSGDYYSVAGDTFYLFTNMEYTFSAAGTFEHVDPENSKYATLTGNTITTTNKTGYFEFTNTVNGETKKYKANVLPYVSQFTLGKGLSNFLDSNSKNSSFYGKNATYTIGRYFEDKKLTELYEKGLFDYKNNGYKFDLNILTNGGMSIDPLNYGNYLVYKFYDSTGAEINEIGVYDDKTGAWSFTAPVGEYKVEISINDLYVAPIQLEDEIIKPLTFNFTIDNSVNVYNNSQLKIVFNDITIGNGLRLEDGTVERGISIHQTIKAELSNNQYYDYWKDSPINPAVAKDVDRGFNQEEALKTHSPINIDNSDVLDLYDQPNYANGNVYERVSRTALSETYYINGNCFAIDGSSLPFVNIYSRGNQSSIPGYEIPNTAVAIIKYVVTATGGKESTLVLNDLHIVGNSNKPVLDESSENFQTSIQLMNKNAGGYQAVNLGYGCSVEVNNALITKTIIGININIDCSATIVDTKVVDCWFNGVYGYGNSNLTIQNSYLRDFGGAVIHLEDTQSSVKYKDSTYNEIVEEYPSNAKITIDEKSVLENYVSGDEGYFKAYSLEVLILKLKAGFEANVNEKNWTMIKQIKDPVTGLEYEKVNLIMLLVARGDNAEEELIDEANNIKGAGRNMMQLGFGGSTTEGLKQFNSATGLGLTHLNSSLLMNQFGGSDLLVQKVNPEYSQAGYLGEGVLLTYQPTLPGFGGSIIVTGVNGRPNK